MQLILKDSQHFLIIIINIFIQVIFPKINTYLNFYLNKNYYYYLDRNFKK